MRFIRKIDGKTRVLRLKFDANLFENLEDDWFLIFMKERRNSCDI